MQLNLTLSMNKEILRLAIPSILANITVPIVGIVDVAIVGHISNASAIGGIAVGSMFFDLLYWNFGFLRVGTGGMTAQAFGRRDHQAMMDIFSQSIFIALGAALFVLMIGWLFVDLVLLCMPCSPEVEVFARQYFNVRIWAAPATLSLMAFKGWFIGTQNTVSPMICDIIVNVINIIASFWLAVYTPLGVIGVAYGTAIAQYSGLIAAILLLISDYREFFHYLNIKAGISWKKLKHLAALNGNLFLRSIGFMIVYVGFTSLTSSYGDEALAVGAIMMKLFMVFSYFVDGFAYAGEALVGRFIGEQNYSQVNRAVKNLFIWCLGVGVLFTIIYWVSGDGMVRVMTSDAEVIENSRPFLFWLIAMPLISCAAFMWDGIYIGAVAGRQVRDCMIFSALGFIIGYLALFSTIGVQAVYVGYFIHLLVRTVYLSVHWKKVLKKCIPGLIMFFMCININAQADTVLYEPVDSAYMAGIERMMVEAKQQQVKSVIEKYEDVMTTYENSFHTDGINILVRGILSASKDKDFRNNNTQPLKNYDCDVLDYGVAFSPLVVTWTLKAFGVESRSKMPRMLMADALALGLTCGVNTGVKGLVDERRPNGKDLNSMPSGHTAMAFACATILHREYGYLSPWVSVGGYTMATATQYLRLRHNAHWVTDLYVGAGIGTIATNFAYFITDKIFGDKGINRPRLTMADINRTLQYNACPTSLSLISGIEWGKEDKINTSTTFTTGLTYSQFFNKNFAVEAMGRIATTYYYNTDINASGNLDIFHLDAGIRYSLLLSPDVRLDGRVFSGVRYLDNNYLGLDHEIKPEIGVGLYMNFVRKEKYAYGMGCDFNHIFSDWFSNRWVICMEWKILL